MGWPNLSPKVEMSCDSKKPKPGTTCNLTCPDGYKLAAPATTILGKNCDWTHGKYKPSCVIIVQGWGRDKSKKPTNFRDLGNKELPGLPPIVEMNGNSKQILTTVRPKFAKTIQPKTTKSTTTPISGRNFDEEHSSNSLLCPELPEITDAVYKCSNGRSANSKCQYRCSTPGNTLTPQPRRSMRCK